MELHLKRKHFTEISTIGDLSIDGKFFCYVLEDKVRPAGEKKVYGKTAIPAGKYKIILNVSNRFKKKMPLLLKVPGFEGIRIHAGNTANDSEGCLICGKTFSKDFVGQSKNAFMSLMNVLENAKDEITITIE